MLYFWKSLKLLENLHMWFQELRSFRAPKIQYWWKITYILSAMLMYSVLLYNPFLSYIIHFIRPMFLSSNTYLLNSSDFFRWSRKVKRVSNELAKTQAGTLKFQKKKQLYYDKERFVVFV